MQISNKNIKKIYQLEDKGIINWPNTKFSITVI